MNYEYSTKCPMCGTDEINTSGVYMANESEVKEDCICDNCHAEWTNIFLFSGLEIVDTLPVDIYDDTPIGI